MNLYDSFNECLEIGNNYIHVENDGDFFVKRSGNALRLFFEWSDDKADWRNNFSFLAIPWKPYKGMTCPWFCHRGFLKVWKSIKPYIEADVLDPEVKKIEIVGYSHGAAIALLCHEFCTFKRPDCEVQGVGFGCPRVFWGIVPKKVKERLKHFKVVRNGRDIVTHVPPVLFGYHHISEIVEVGNGESEGLIDDHRPENYLAHLK